ncbi:DMT family transporter [Aequorivita vladivostokensis]|uniref:Multidrug transporter n=1 Tax=Aequorivita vladivostokensis TaxID=171194 RepID=A0ABR5DIB8_9FLAO|nr:DMT family transporter [Aequorivita vladivostokensis]KJJ38514.1 multidrug transporter [Aequorivita vladivostokensis]MAB56361.1 EamA/RhaT family transporter [Aequorivita sp.]MBF29905.1 EamA/RhaT family transporter [Aequorivita sp.]
MTNPRIFALLAATTASTIYGINHTIAKGLMPDVIQPFGFILLRVSGAALVFWVISLFFPSEKVERRDWFRFIICAFFGMVLNMLAFFKGLSLSTPINSSVIITISPVLLLVLSAFILRERITWVKSLGIFLGLGGALVLILFGLKAQPNAPNIPLGNLLFIINATSYSVYLILVKPLVPKYSSITLMKFLFLFAFLINLPIGISEFSEVNWTNLPFEAIWKLAFVVICTTVMTYLLNIYALKQLSPSTIGAFIYLQPVIAVLFAVIVGADSLTALRIGAAALIFLGVYLSTIKRARKISD